MIELPEGKAETLTAKVIFSDDSEFDVSREADYSSSAPEKVVVGNVGADKGLVQLKAAGTDGIVVADDPNRGELVLESSDEEAERNEYKARMVYRANTDGGVIGPFLGEEFRLAVKILETGDVNSAWFYSADDQFFSLKRDDDTISSFVISYKNQKTCDYGTMPDAPGDGEGASQEGSGAQ